MSSVAARRGAPAGAGGALAETVALWASAGHARALALLTLLALGAYLPGFASLQPMDRDEPRFAQASKQMLETGDLVDIRFQGEARHKKPVGIYWLQAAAVSLGEAAGVPDARRAIWLYRLPSLAGALAAVLLTYWAALAYLARADALLAAALTAVSVLLTVEAHLAKTDAVLTACAVAALGALARVHRDRDAPAPALSLLTPLVFWLAVAVGVLVKGPMVPLFAGLAALALSLRARSGRWLLALRPLAGLGLVLVLAAPWFAGIAWRSGGAFFAEAVGHDMLGKVGTAQTQHWAPPGTYALVSFATLWPLMPLAALAGPFAWRARGEDAVAFLLAWVVPAWLLLEAVPTKLPHYVLPLVPALAILVVLAIRRGGFDADRRGARAAALLVPLVPAGLALGLAVAARRLGDPPPYAALPLLLVASGLALWSWRAFSDDRPARAAWRAVAAGALLGPAVLGLAAPSLAALRVSPRLAALRAAAPCAEPRVASFGYREPSLVFLTGTDLALVETGEGAVDFLAGGDCRLLLVEGRAAARFAAAAAARGLTPEPVGAVDGFNINGGRRVEVVAYAARPRADRP